MNLLYSGKTPSTIEAIERWPLLRKVCTCRVGVLCQYIKSLKVKFTLTYMYIRTYACTVVTII